VPVRERSGAEDRRQRERRAALKRLRRREQAALAGAASKGSVGDPQRVILDSERYAAPLLERLDARARVRLLLWGAVVVAAACAIFSFFTAPLMQVDQAVETTLVLTMLILSYVL
jgi:hypothetical protein